MMLPEMSGPLRSFVERFFGPGNLLRWSQIVDGSLGEAAVDYLRPWLEDLKRGNTSVILPRALPDRWTVWYALAFSPQQGRELRDELTAFLGSSYSGFDGRLAVLNPADPVEAALLEWSPSQVYRLEVPADPELRKAARDAIVLLRQLRGQRPQGRAILRRPTGRILRDFELALQLGDEELGRAHLAELRAGGHVNAQNLEFLEVRLLAAVGKWPELLKAGRWDSVRQVRRPLRVTEAFLRAVYQVEFERFERANEAAGAVEHFRSSVLPQHEDLFRARGSMTAPEALKAFLIFSAAADPPRPELRDDVLAAYALQSADLDWALTIAGQVPPSRTPAGSIEEQAAERLRANDFAGAFPLLLQRERKPETLMKLLHCAYELDTSQFARQALQALDSADTEAQQAVLGTRLSRQIAESLRRIADDAAPADWFAWLRRLNVDGPWPEAVETAARGVGEWDLGTFSADPALLELFCDTLLQNRSATAEETLRNAVPHLLAAFLPAGRPHPALRRVYQSLTTLLALDDDVGPATLGALQELIAARLELGTSAREYADLLAEFEHVCRQVASPWHLDWMLDTLELLAIFPKPDEPALAGLVSALLATLAAWTRRVTPEQWLVLESLLADLGYPAALADYKPERAAESEAPGLPQDLLAGKTVAIYTLAQAVARRVEALLERAFPAVRVRTSHDLVSSDRLRTLAREADIFLIAPRSAKHAAFDAIQAARPAGRVTLFSQGKGAASLVRALYDHLGKVRASS